jgi:hypothetical protein
MTELQKVFLTVPTTKNTGFFPSAGGKDRFL